MNTPLYRRLLGTRFDDLPARVRELHDLTGRAVWVGRADVQRGRSILARIVAALLSLPPEGLDQALRVTFERVGDMEVWSREFGTSPFQSLQYARDGVLCERIGPFTCAFALDASQDGLTLLVRDVSFLGVPLPRWLHPAVRTFEHDCEGRYLFEIEVRLPAFGLLECCSGWLERSDGNAAQGSS